VSIREDNDKYYDLIDEDGNFDPAAHMDNFVISATSKGSEVSIEIQVSSLPKLSHKEKQQPEYQEVYALIEKFRQSLIEEPGIYAA
jgi:hypothetical protein